MEQLATTRSWEANFRILWSGQFITIIGLTGITPFLPFYMQQIGVNDTKTNLLWSGLALAAPAIAYALTSPIWGRMGDRWSRKWMFVRSLLGLSVSLLCMGMAQTPLQFFLSRLCQGAFGGISDASTSFIGSAAPKDKQGLYLGRFQNGVAAGSLIGPLLGGILADQWGFRPMLFFTGALTGICGILAGFLLKESEREEQQSSPPSSGYFPALKNLMSDPTLRAFLFGGIAAKFGVFGLLAVFGPYVSTFSTFSSSPTMWIGLLDAATHFGTLLGSSWWGKKNDRSPVEKNFVMASAICGLLIISQACLPFVAWLFLLRILQGFFFSSLIQSVILIVIRTSDDFNRGLSIGITNSLLVTGQIAGSFSGGLLGGYLPFAWIIAFMGTVFILSSILVGIMISSLHKKGSVQQI
ncbi:MFS transporter [Brevibacillus sp. SYSU BS000544]|uniref:MFS transporter n=1 Tax=Brevibacillus sp. SYSU BS000544 TaxID=3416443 RepID=UPI003CE44E65